MTGQRMYQPIANYLETNHQLLIDSNNQGKSALEGVLPDLEDTFHSDDPNEGIFDFNLLNVRQNIGKEVQKVMERHGYCNDVSVKIKEGISRFFTEAMRYKRIEIF